MANRLSDIAGKRFGHLVAEEPAGKNAKDGVLWRCRCDCGNERVVGAGQLNSGRYSHCGCQATRNRSVGHIQAAARRAYKTEWERRKRAAAKPSAPVERPNNGPLDMFLYAYRAMP